MHVFMTGSTGFVGTGILSRLLRQGHKATCLVRRGSRVSNAHTADSRVRIMEGDLFQPESYFTAVAECDAVIHLVGIIREDFRKRITFEQVHAEGTKAIIEACRKAGFAGSSRRFIHMSALGARSGAASAYFRTKWAAEEYVRNSGIPYIIFRPSVIFGPEDQFVNMLADLVKLPLVPVMGDGNYRLQPVSLKTVSEIFVKALSSGPDYTAFDLGGPEQITYNEMLVKIAKAAGRKNIQLAHMPLWLMKPMISLLERYSFFPITSTQLAMLLEESICREGVPCYETYHCVPIPFTEGIREYIRP